MEGASELRGCPGIWRESGDFAHIGRLSDHRALLKLKHKRKKNASGTEGRLTLYVVLSPATLDGHQEVGVPRRLKRVSNLGVNLLP